MGKATGFLEYERKEDRIETCERRIRHFQEFHIPSDESERRAQAARCKDCGVPFCQINVTIGGMAAGCPLGNLIPEWNDFIYRGNDRQALARLRKTNNFPEFTSRVCPSLCEASCTGHLHGTPVTNRENERYLVEYGFEHGLMGPEPPAVRSGKKIAVIGSGPAGLAAADQLNRRGHSVTVFERADRPGGLLMYGIPNMKLDKSVVTRRTELMQAEGVEFWTGTEIAAPEAAAALLAEYDAVILACGAAKPRDIAVPGREAAGIHFAVDYLRANTRHLLEPKSRLDAEYNAKGKRVLIIGGGDTGNDCVGTAVRQGAKKVTQLEMLPCPPAERAPDNPWPEWPKILKTDYGQQEAIFLYGKDPRIWQTTIKAYLTDAKGKLTGVEAVKLVPVKDEKTGRFRMEEVPGSEYEIRCDMVLIAAGFLGAEEKITEAFGIARSARGTVAVRTPEGHQTENPKVFAAGDCRRGQSLVVWAIHEGREAAREADAYLMGYSGLR